MLFEVRYYTSHSPHMINATMRISATYVGEIWFCIVVCNKGNCSVLKWILNVKYAYSIRV